MFSATLQLTAGQLLQILVGQKGESPTNGPNGPFYPTTTRSGLLDGGGGGGGTFVSQAHVAKLAHPLSTIDSVTRGCIPNHTFHFCRLAGVGGKRESATYYYLLLFTTTYYLLTTHQRCGWKAPVCHLSLLAVALALATVTTAAMA